MDAYQFYTETFHLTDPVLINTMVKNSEKRHYRKGDLIVHIGEIQKEICFMESGVFRGYMMDYHGNEMTDCFGNRRGEIAGCMFFGPVAQGLVSSVAFEMLVEGDFFCVPITAILGFLDKSMEAMAIYNQIINNGARKHWDLKRIMVCCSAMQRYQWFLEEYPGLADCINIKYIASFLGMKPETLSRIRKTLADDVH